MNIKELRLVVGSGPTREWIDPVRFISNPSTGRMGHAIAEAGLSRFKEVVFVSGPVAPPYDHVDGAVNYMVETTEEMKEHILRSLGDGTVLIMAAAPADYTPAVFQHSKIKKDPELNLEIKLKPTPDILMETAAVSSRYADLFRVGFAAETDHVRENALAKLKKKDLDFVCANMVFREEAGFGANPNSLLVIERDGTETPVGPAEKSELAKALLDLLSKRIDRYAHSPSDGHQRRT